MQYISNQCSLFLLEDRTTKKVSDSMILRVFMIPVNFNECLEEKWGQGQFTEQLMNFILFQILFSHHFCILQDAHSNRPVKMKDIEYICREKL